MYPKLYMRNLIQADCSRYIETMGVLYGENKFIVGTGMYIECLESCLMPQHLSLMKEIGFYISYSNPPPHQFWDRIWQQVASFKGLKIVHLGIAFDSYRERSVKLFETDLLKYLDAIVPSRSFELNFVWQDIY